MQSPAVLSGLEEALQTVSDKVREATKGWTHGPQTVRVHKIYRGQVRGYDGRLGAPTPCVEAVPPVVPVQRDTSGQVSVQYNPHLGRGQMINAPFSTFNMNG